MNHALRRRVGRRGWNKRRVIGGVDELPADADHQQHNRDLGDDDDRVDGGRFRDTANQQRRQKSQDDDGGDVDDAVHAVGRRLERRMAPFIGNVQPDVLEHLVEVLAPGDGHGRGADGVLENQVPADNPGDELAHRRVRVRVGASRDRNHRRELGVAQARERAPDAGHHERDGHRRTRPLGDCCGGSHEEPGADDRADAERDERARAERPFQRRLAAARNVDQKAVD